MSSVKKHLLMCTSPDLVGMTHNLTIRRCVPELIVSEFVTLQISFMRV